MGKRFNEIIIVLPLRKKVMTSSNWMKIIHNLDEYRFSIQNKFFEHYQNKFSEHYQNILHNPLNFMLKLKIKGLVLNNEFID